MRHLQKNITYSSINFFVKVCLLQFKCSRVIFNFSVRIVLYIHCSLFAFCLANTGIPVGLKINNSLWSNVSEQVKIPVVIFDLRCETLFTKSSWMESIKVWDTPEPCAFNLWPPGLCSTVSKS